MSGLAPSGAPKKPHGARLHRTPCLPAAFWPACSRRCRSVAGARTGCASAKVPPLDLSRANTGWISMGANGSPGRAVAALTSIAPTPMCPQYRKQPTFRIADLTILI